MKEKSYRNDVSCGYSNIIVGGCHVVNGDL